MNKLVSIVIPMFNAKENLIECIESIILQDYKYLEVIFVDDGSTDDSAKICVEYCAKYPFLSIYSQENQGPAASRNKGMELANGEYICFVDADDYLDGHDAISKMVQCAESNQADIVCGSFRKVTEAGVSDVNYHHLDELDIHDSVEFRFRGFFQYGHLGFIWGKLYRKQFIIDNQLAIPDYPYIEDKAFNMRCCICRPKFAMVRESVYVYRLSNQVVDFQDKDDFVTVWTGVASDLDEYCVQKNRKETDGDMQAFHLFLGLYSLGKQKLNEPNMKLYTLYKVLSGYGQTSDVTKYMKYLAKGKYLNDIDSFGWKILIRTIAIICACNGYFLLALGMFVMKGLGIDKKVISKKYSRKE